MKQILLVFYKALQQIRESLKTSRSLITVKQRAGNRYLHAFVASFILSIIGNYLVFKKEKEIENQYLSFRQKIETQIVTKNSDSIL